jgi:hypothetical protein
VIPDCCKKRFFAIPALSSRVSDFAPDLRS